MASLTKISFVGLLCLLMYGCSTPAIIRIQQKKWSAAESSLRKSLRKDTLNAEAKFVYAQYYLSEGNPDFDVDSSYAWTKKALLAWQQSSEKQRERLQKIDIDSFSITGFRSHVDSAAFERARVGNTVQSYEHFIERFPSAVGVSKAIELRDELAYVEALRVNTPAAFKKYVTDFPLSLRLEDASDRYEQLIFQERTRSGNIDNYKSFLAEFPNSARREEAERFVFEVSTSSGLIDDYLNFIREFPKSSQVNKARNILYYLLRESGEERPAILDNDSLRMLDERNQGYWVPFYKNGLYGFMNDDGAEVMEPQFESIDSTYLCGELKNDFLVTSSGVYSRSGALLLKNRPTSAIDMGNGFISINEGGRCHILAHQSGFRVGPECSLDSRIVADQFISLMTNTGWYVYAINGRQLTTSPYEGVFNVDKLIMLKRYNKYIVVQAQQIAAIAHQKPLNESLVFDEVRAWGEG
ncbi:MAG TPA: hypothetical protein VFE50_07515, partial [Cyclobacteriaceae bacterium]|nr:hypothetical protein [Cyclobacteriaceae bacterium]